MATAAAAWDVLAKAANVAQVIAVLVAVSRGLLRVQRSNGRECAELERRTRRLLALLQGPTTPPRSETVVVGPIVKALGDAAGLVDSYRKSSLWRRGRMATQLRDMQDLVDSYYVHLLHVNGLQQQPSHHHTAPLSRDTSVLLLLLVNLLQQQAIHHHTVPLSPDMAQTPSWPEVSLAQTQGADDGIAQAGTNTDPASGCERNEPALLPIVISHA